MKANKDQIKKIIGIIAVAIVAVAWVVVFVHKTQRPYHPTDAIPFWHETEEGNSSIESLNEIGHLEKLIKTTIIADIDFQELPLKEAMQSLFAKINHGRPAEQHVIHTYSDEVTNENMRAPITLELRNVPAIEGLRYTTSLAQLEYDILDDNTVEILALSQPDSTILQAKFPVLIPLTADTGPGPFDVTAELSRAGVDFHDGGYANYYPDKGLVVTEATQDQMELIQAYFSSACVIYEPTLLEKVRYGVSEFFNPTPPPTPYLAPTSTAPPVDPFASPLLPTEPDPFTPNP